ncbi:MAG: hypothetical protein WA880_15265 [Ornithinimicrobium sp.]
MPVAANRALKVLSFLAWVWFGITSSGAMHPQDWPLALLTILILLNVATQILVLRAEKDHADAQ